MSKIAIQSGRDEYCGLIFLRIKEEAEPIERIEVGSGVWMMIRLLSSSTRSVVGSVNGLEAAIM